MKSRAFSFVELLLVISIISLLAAIVVLHFVKLDAKQPQETWPKKIEVDGSKRFAVESHGSFYSGGEWRGIVVITDSDTHQQYLCVPGCGMCQMPTPIVATLQIIKTEAQ